MVALPTLQRSALRHSCLRSSICSARPAYYFAGDRLRSHLASTVAEKTILEQNATSFLPASRDGSSVRFMSTMDAPPGSSALSSNILSFIWRRSGKGEDEARPSLAATNDNAALFANSVAKQLHLQHNFSQQQQQQAVSSTATAVMEAPATSSSNTQLSHAAPVAEASQAQQILGTASVDSASQTALGTAHSQIITAPHPHPHADGAATRLRLHKDLHHPQHLQHQHNHSHHYLQAHPTFRLMEARWRQGSMPGKRSDGCKVGLVVEGGGMRGCVSGAMLMGILNLGLQHSIDAIYGASAGAINATYFLANQPQGLTVYADHLCGPEFFNFSALWRRNGGKVMNLEHLFKVMDEAVPLDWDAVLHSPIPLKVVASSIDSLQPVLLEGFASKQDLVDCLMATATVPEIAGPPRHVRGQRLVDAAVFEPVPVGSAIQDGCTHVLVLCTRPAPVQVTPWRRHVNKTVTQAVKKVVLNPPYMSKVWDTDLAGSIDEHYEALAGALSHCPHEIRRSMGAYVLPCYPATSAGCHPLTTNREVLHRAQDQGLAAMHSMFGWALAETQ